jgi:hypothetical protein
VKLPSVTSRDERRALKEWLTGLLPDGVSRYDVADELGVDRKTISTMLNPDRPGFGNGLTMLRYLQLVGAVDPAPQANPASSRLAAIEARLEKMPTEEDMRRGLDTLRAAIDAQASPGTRRAKGSGR